MAGNYFNANNVFSTGWDLNPVSQQTGIARDDLAQQRDAYLQPLYQQYRSAVGVGGGAGHAAADDQSLFNDSNFQNFVQTGQVPTAPGGGGNGSSSVTAQWSTGPQSPMVGTVTDEAGTAATQNGQRNTDLYNTLMQRANESLAVSPNDPTIRAQTDAYSAQQDRGARNTLADLAEKAGPNANLTGQTRLANEQAAQNTGAFQAQLMGNELQARRNDIAQALNGMQGMLTADEQAQLERELGVMDNAIKQQSLTLQGQSLNQDWQKALLNNQQFLDQLGLNAEDRAAYWDAVNSGTIGG